MRATNTDESGPSVPQIVEPVYGLYPGLQDFSDEYNAQDYRDWVEQSNGDPLPAPLALCIRDSSRDAQARLSQREIAGSGITGVIQQELKLQGALFDADRPVQQLICTGSVAAGWTDDQLYELISTVQDSFTMGQEVEGWCACVGSTEITGERLRLLQVLGFLNIRLAVPLDNALDDTSQRALLDEIEALAIHARSLGLRQIMIDLCFTESTTPLSLKRLETFAEAVRPELFRLVATGASAPPGKPLPQRDAYADVLAGLGYDNIGLDWFVRPGDMWCRPPSSRPLNWSMLGYTDMPSPDVIGIGPGAISTLGDFYSQNEHRWLPYREMVTAGRIPIARGLELESDDRLRREIITAILTDSRINPRAIETKWGIQFEQFFHWEIKQLERFREAGWMEERDDSIVVLARGRSELSQFCETFDRRLHTEVSGSAPLFA